MRKKLSVVILLLVVIFLVCSDNSNITNGAIKKSVMEKARHIKEFIDRKTAEGKDLSDVIPIVKKAIGLIENDKLDEANKLLDEALEQLKDREFSPQTEERISLKKELALNIKLEELKEQIFQLEQQEMKNIQKNGKTEGENTIYYKLFLAEALDLINKAKIDEAIKILDESLDLFDKKYQQEIKINQTTSKKTPEYQKIHQEVYLLNENFTELLNKKIPSFNAARAIRLWYEAKKAKDINNLSLAKSKLKDAIELLKGSHQESLQSIFKSQYKIKSNSIKNTGKIIPPSNGGAYIGYWGIPFLPVEKGFAKITNSHIALIFDTMTWYSSKRYLSWDNLFSFKNSILLEPNFKNQEYLIITPKQLADLFYIYGSVYTLSWIASFGEFTDDINKAPRNQEIIEGKWDSYIERTAKEIKEWGNPIMIELLHEFDEGTTKFNGAPLCFGKKGDELYLKICNSKNDLEKKAKSKFVHDCKTLYNQYGDTQIPDGPERVRDMWKHVHDVFDNVGVTNVTWFQHTATAHGYPSPQRAPEILSIIGAPWNKIDYYWPGRNYIDWIGTSLYYKTTKKDPHKILDFHFGISWFYNEIKKSKYWNKIPILLLEFCFVSDENKSEMIAKVFGDYIVKEFPNIAGFTYLDPPHPLGLLSGEDKAWQKYVTNNPYYVQYPEFHSDHIAPGKINDLAGKVKNGKIILTWTAPGDDNYEGTASYYIVKYRAQPIDNSGGILKDFRKEPWRLWSRYETKDIEGNPKPEKATTKQKMEISGFKPGKYYFGIQSVDEVPYNSKISNIIEVEISQKN